MLLIALAGTAAARRLQRMRRAGTRVGIGIVAALFAALGPAGCGTESANEEDRPPSDVGDAGPVGSPADDPLEGAGAAPRPVRDPKPEPVEPNGQTGSIGSAVCGESSACAEMNELRLAPLREPAKTPPRTLIPSACEGIDRNTPSGDFTGSACRCTDESGRFATLGPGDAGCFVYGRAMNCLWDDSEWDGCDSSDPHACDAPCAELEARMAADDAHAFDAKQLATACELYNCNNAIEIDGQCYGGNWGWGMLLPFDCALGGEGILEAAAAAEQSGALDTPNGSLPNHSPYRDGSDGFVQLTVSHNFEGTTETGSSFGLFAQFFEPIDGSESSAGNVLDPPEGIDDCAVFRGNGSGASPRISWRQVAEATLLDGADEIPLEEFMSGELFSYGAELERAPRFGERYGLHVAGGQFGAAFDSDRLELPQDLAVDTFEHGARFERSDLALRWSGSGADPLLIRLLIASGLSDFGGDFEVECLVKDDGEFTIPAEVLQLVPDGIAYAYVTRSNRALQTGGGHNLLIAGEIANTYHFALSAACDRSELRAACEKYAQATVDAYTSCGASPQSFAELCPDYLFESCITCPEYFACKAEQTSCGNGGLFLGQCVCD